MALPLAPVAIKLLKASGHVIMRFQGALSIMGLIVAGTFSINAMMREAAGAALALWPLVALACFFLLVKEFIRGWLKVKNREIDIVLRERQ